MAVYKCKMCDAALEVQGNSKIIVCQYCGTQQSIEENDANHNDGSEASYLKRAFLFLEDGEFTAADEYCEKVLDINPERSEAYLGKLMAEREAKKQEDLLMCDRPLSESRNYDKILRFGEKGLIAVVIAYNEQICQRIKSNLLEENYTNAVKRMRAAATEFQYRAVALLFSEISGYKDADEKEKECLERAEQLRLAEVERWKQNLEIQEKKEKRNTRIISIIMMILFILVVFILIRQAIIIPDRKMKEANALLASEKYDEAYDILRGMGKEEIISQNKYERAVAFIASEQYEEAYTLLNGLTYEDSEKKQEELLPIIYSERFKEIDVGDQILFGSYEQDANKNNGLEPIPWVVLEKKDNEVLLLSKYIIEQESYNEEGADTKWESSSIYGWLNNTFLPNAFHEYEKEMILSTDLGQVFLLSEDEVVHYFPTYESRRAELTKIIEENAVYDFDDLFDVNYNWWVRDDEYYYLVHYIDADGEIEFTDFVSHYYGVRPALWISVNP